MPDKTDLVRIGDRHLLRCEEMEERARAMCAMNSALAMRTSLEYFRGLKVEFDVVMLRLNAEEDVFVRRNQICRLYGIVSRASREIQTRLDWLKDQKRLFQAKTTAPIRTDHPTAARKGSLAG